MVNWLIKLTFLSTILLVCCNNSEQIKQIERQIMEIDTKIACIRPTPIDTRIQFRRLFDITIPLGSLKPTLNEICLLPSIGLPSRENYFISMMLQISNNFYTLRGEPLIETNLIQPTLTFTWKNEYTIFTQQLNNTAIQISRLSLHNKKPILLNELVLILPNIQLETYITLLLNTNLSTKQYILVTKHHLEIYNGQGKCQHEISFNSELRQLSKINNQLIILTNTSLYLLSLIGYINTTCIIPNDKISMINIDEYNQKYFYALASDKIYQYEVEAGSCRTIGKYRAKNTSKIHIANGQIFINSNNKIYRLNSSTNHLMEYDLPFDTCEANWKVDFIRKSSSETVLSRICLQNDSLSINLVTLQLEPISSSSIDFSKFKILLIITSFAVVFYITNKRKRQKESTIPNLEETLIQQMFAEKAEAMPNPTS